MSDVLSWLSGQLAPAALQFDLAAAAVALVALLFSIVSFYQQRQINMETLRIQSDNDLIAWLDRVIETLVGLEFLLRDWNRNAQPMQFVTRRDEYLAAISMAIDKGRMYFPKFSLDIIGPQPKPSTNTSRDVMDDLVEIYDLIRDLNPQQPAAIEPARNQLLLKKRAFLAHAREKVNLQRRDRFRRD